MWWIWMQWFPAYWRHLNNSNTLWRQIAIQTEQKLSRTYDNDTQRRQCKEAASCARKIQAYEAYEWMNIIQRSTSSSSNDDGSGTAAAAAAIHKVKTMHDASQSNQKKMQRTIKELRASI